MPGAPDRPAPGHRRYWCLVNDDTSRVAFPDDEVRHLQKVVRLGAGDRIATIDGSGRRFTVELERAGRGLAGTVLEVHDATPEAGPELWLAAALVRPARFEWLVEKAVEVGIAGVLPILSERSLGEARLGEARLERLRRIARGATCQSLRARVPEIRTPTALAELETSGYAAVRIAHGPQPAKIPPPVRSGRALVVVGPEGGFTTAEVDHLSAAGADILSLGWGRLRAETAAIVALSLTRWGADPGTDRSR